MPISTEREDASGQKQGSDPLVWYACYGSNLKRERFKRYILGGRPEGSSREHRGCMNRQPPLKTRRIEIDHRLYFSGLSRSWNNSGVAFIETGKCKAGEATLGRMYLITREQFEEIFAQENRIDVETARIDFDILMGLGRLSVGSGMYDCLIFLGSDGKGDFPVFTFTGSDHGTISYTMPSAEYSETIIDGICETYPDMDRKDAVSYLNNAICRNTIEPDLMKNRCARPHTLENENSRDEGNI